jgi:hypothetical protein
VMIVTEQRSRFTADPHSLGLNAFDSKLLRL